MWSRTSLCALFLGVLVAGCGEREPGVVVTEADPVAERAPVPVDTAARVDPDTTQLDTVLVDPGETVTPDTAAAAPSFDVFWPQFQASVRSGNVSAVTGYAWTGEGGLGAVDLDGAYITAFTEPFKTAVLALTPRDFRREGTARSVRVVVGFDGEGRVVPEDEADTDRSIRLRFDAVGDRYRWVGFEDDV